ncbi:glycosyltransferase family 2 protein [Heliomicrobium undosum]|uniref:glycosyltransferase family 2 protein n=1 Tax=Heliomicrobium undosum TaxID=121734 RepID=UPI002E2D50C2|nr:glycosyltransferase family 2 protein [Heliomicrobium undosum]
MATTGDKGEDDRPVLSIVAPCYNEEAVLPETARRLIGVLEGLVGNRLISPQSMVLFVDDGSSDRTWELIENLHATEPSVKGLKLARNVGHQYALLAGLHRAGCCSDCVVSIDADLQDDVSAIEAFVKKYHEGYDVVYGVRRKREKDSFFKRQSAQGFYRLMRRMGVDIVYDHADYRLLSRRVLKHLEDFREANLFLRGIIPLIGFPSTCVYYDRMERFAGTSKYPLKKMLAFAFDGITSFSVKPIRVVTFLGMMMLVVSLSAGLYLAAQGLIGQPVPDGSFLMFSIWFVGGVNLLGIGLNGEYMGRIYREVKDRPKYIVERDLLASEPAGGRSLPGLPGSSGKGAALPESGGATVPGQVIWESPEVTL